MRYLTTITILLAVALLAPGPTSRLRAQDDLPAINMPPRPETAPAAPDAVAEEDLISLNFNNTPIEMVLQEYCTLTGRTLLMAPGVSGNITLRTQTRLTKSESLRAIETMLAMHNVALIKEGDRFVKALPIAAARQEGMPIRIPGPDDPPLEETDKLVSEIIHLKHIDVGAGQTAIAGLIHGYGKIQPLERINALMVTDTGININRIRELLNQVDQPLVIREQLKIMTIQYAKASEIKTKLEEIIAQARPEDREVRPTAARPRASGPPGVEGVVRATRAPRGTTAAAGAEAESTPGEIIVGNVQMVADDRTGLLIIITRPENIPFFEDIVSAFDVPTDPDVIVNVIRLEYAEADTVASMLNNLIGATDRDGTRVAAGVRRGDSNGDDGERTADLRDFVRRETTAMSPEDRSKIGELSAASITILPDERINALIIMASPADQRTLAEIIEDMDMMLSQVLIEAVILEINLDKTLETGFDWVQRSMIAYDGGADGRSQPRIAYAGRGGGGRGAPQDAMRFNAATDFSGGSGLSYYMTLFELNLDAVLRMVATDSRTRILSSPVILTTDNREAQIDVSTERYFYKGKRYVSTTTGQGVWEDDVETRRVGINLTVTPKINVKGFVVMDVVQKIDNIAGSQRINEVDWPIIASREISASISVQGGETIVLGGLSMQQDSKSESRVPILGRIPLLGMLFRGRDKQDTRSEVVVFITPYVLDSPHAIRAESERRKDVVDEDGLWTQGWSASRLAKPADGRRAADRAPRQPAPAPLPPDATDHPLSAPADPLPPDALEDDLTVPPLSIP